MLRALAGQLYGRGTNRAKRHSHVAQAPELLTALAECSVLSLARSLQIAPWASSGQIWKRCQSQLVQQLLYFASAKSNEGEFGWNCAGHAAKLKGREPASCCWQGRMAL